MAEKIKKLRLNLRRNAREILLGEGVEKFRVGFIVELILPGARSFSGVEIVIRQIQFTLAHFVKEFAVAIQGCIEAGLEHSLSLRRGSPQLQDLQGTNLRQDAHEKSKKSFAHGGRLIILPPSFLITRA